MLNIFHKPFKGHKGKISGVAFAPSGLEATTSAYSHQFLNRDAIVWNIPTGEIARILRGHQAGVFSVACSSDGNRTATGGGGVMKWNSWIHDNAVRIWNQEGSPCGKFGDDLFFVNALAFSPDGRTLLSGSNNSAPKADTKDGSSLRLWDTETYTEIKRFGSHKSAVNSVVFSPDGKQVAAGNSGMNSTGRSSGETTLRVWAANTGEEHCLFDHTGWINAIAYSPDGEHLYSAGRGVYCWDIRSGKETNRIEDEYVSFVHCASLSPDGQYLAIGTGGQMESGAPYQNCFVRLYGTQKFSEVIAWPHKFPVTALAFSPDGRCILAGGEHGEIHLWQFQ